MIVLDLSILNQKGTPMFYSDTLAARPAAGIVGRIFIATDSPFGIYRDTGTAWDQISGASTFSGSLATGQVAFGSATNTISGTNNLFWNNVNNRLGIGTNTPTSALQVLGSGVFNSGASSFPIDGTSTSSLSVIRLTNSSGAVSFGRDGTFATIEVNATGRLFIGSTGNVLIGSSADNGTRLQVYGGAYINGNLLLSGTGSTILSFPSSNYFYYDAVGSGAKLAFYGLGALKFTFGSNSNGMSINPSSTADQGLTGELAVLNRSITNGNIFNAATAPNITFGGAIVAIYNATGLFSLDSINNINGSQAFGVRIANTLNSINPNQNCIYTGFNFSSTINQNIGVGINAITRGLHLNPTLTSVFDYRSIEWSNNIGWGLYGAGTSLNYLGGTLGIKTTSPYSPSTFSLDVNGGLLVKNTAGTTAQITLINADPSLGGNNGFLVASVGGTSGGSFVDLQGYYGTSIVGSTALRLNPAGGAVIVNSTTNSGEQFQLTGTIRVNGQTSGSAGGNSGQHLIINCDGTSYKIALLNP